MTRARPPHAALAQWVTLNMLGGLLLGSFLLLDIGAPKLEATLFGSLCATSVAFRLVIDDLSNPRCVARPPRSA